MNKTTQPNSRVAHNSIMVSRFPLPRIGVGDGGRAGAKKSGKYFSGKNHVKLGYFVIFFGHISCKIREFC